MIANSGEPHKFDVAIVGGGIGGLCLAIGLIKYSHINVQIYEGAHAFAEIGAGITVGPNARRALKLLDPGCEQAFCKHKTGNGPDFPASKNVYHRFVWAEGPKSGDKIADVWCEDGQQSVHRAHFLDELVKLVPSDIAHFDKRLTKIEENPGGRTTLNFKDGTTATADCVIGADGLHSVVRKHMIPPNHPSYHPSFADAAAYRGLIPIEQARAVLGDQFTQIATLHSGHRRFIMTYPVDFHKLLNVVAVDCTITQWVGDPNQQADLETMKQRFSGLGSTASSIVGLLDKPDTRIWSLWDMSPLPTYVRSTMALMGDAAHATTPYMGQGAAQSVEDALVLSSLLGKVNDLGDLGYALQAYDCIRRPRSQKVVKTSREVGRLFGLQIPEVLDDSNFFKENIDDRIDWVFNRDMQLQVDQAFVMVEELKTRDAEK